MSRPAADAGDLNSTTVDLEGARAARIAAQDALAQVEDRRQTAAREADEAAEAVRSARQAFISDVGDTAEKALVASNDRVVVAKARLQVLGADALSHARSQLDQALAAEDQAERRLAYEGGQRIRDAAVETFLREYPRAASALVLVAVTMAEASRAVAQVNTNLPTGCLPLKDAEDLARDQPFRPETVVETHREQWWVYSRTKMPLSEAEVRAVQPISAGLGFIAGQGSYGAYKTDVELQEFDVETYHPSDAGRFAARLSGLELPGLYPGTYYLKPCGLPFAPADRAIISDGKPSEQTDSRPVLARAAMVSNPNVTIAIKPPAGRVGMEDQS